MRDAVPALMAAGALLGSSAGKQYAPPSGLDLSLARRLTSWLAAEAQIGFSPSDPGEPAFSASRFEGLLGLRGGPRLGAQELFAGIRPGFVSLSEAPEPIICHNLRLGVSVGLQF